MNANMILRNILGNQRWLERALLALAEANVWHDEKDAQIGIYMVRWIETQRNKNVPLGQCLNGDLWPGRARHLAQQYVPELMQIAYTKALADAKKYAALTKEARLRARKLKKELAQMKKSAPNKPI